MNWFQDSRLYPCGLACVYRIGKWIIESFAVASSIKLYTHMHGLTFEARIWLLAGSTRFRSLRTLLNYCWRLYSQLKKSKHIKCIAFNAYAQQVFFIWCACNVRNHVALRARLKIANVPFIMLHMCLGFWIYTSKCVAINTHSAMLPGRVPLNSVSSIW